MSLVSVSMETVAMVPSSGQTWRLKDGGTTTVIRGRRMASVAHASSAEHGFVETPLAEFLAGFEYVGCDHATYCCMQHHAHVTPHTACVMR